MNSAQPADIEGHLEGNEFGEELELNSIVVGIRSRPAIRKLSAHVPTEAG